MGKPTEDREGELYCGPKGELERWPVGISSIALIDIIHDKFCFEELSQQVPSLKIRNHIAFMRKKYDYGY